MTADQQARASQIVHARDALILAIGSDPGAPDVEHAVLLIEIACECTLPKPEKPQ